MLNAELYKVLNCLNVLFYAVDEAQVYFKSLLQWKKVQDCTGEHPRKSLRDEFSMFIQKTTI